MKAIKYITILIASVVLFNSCTKQVAGPAGPTGSQGTQGPPASYYVVIDSVPVTTPSSWVANGSLFSYTFTNIAPLTTPNYSIVEVYVSTTSPYDEASTWNQLPAGNILAAGDAVSASYGVYTVEVYYTAQAAVPLWFKIIVINQP